MKVPRTAADAARILQFPGGFPTASPLPILQVEKAGCVTSRSWTGVSAEGRVKEAAGKVRETAGKAIGSTTQQIKGTANKVTGGAWPSAPILRHRRGCFPPSKIIQAPQGGRSRQRSRRSVRGAKPL